MLLHPARLVARPADRPRAARAPARPRRARHARDAQVRARAGDRRARDGRRRRRGAGASCARRSSRSCRSSGLRAAAAGTHPFTVWHETVVSSDGRYKLVYGSMRELARREPTFALHVHVGVRDPEARDRARRPDARRTCRCCSRCRRTRRSGRAATPASRRRARRCSRRSRGSASRARSTATPHYVEVVDLLVRSGAFPEPTFLWWDVRPQPRFGTVEVRIMDAQTSVEDSAALVALVQSLARLECEEGYACEQLLAAPEVLDENRFVAARDGHRGRADRAAARAQGAGPREGRPGPGGLRAARARARVRRASSSTWRRVTERPPAARQVLRARRPERLPGLVRSLAEAFAPAP